MTKLHFYLSFYADSEILNTSPFIAVSINLTINIDESSFNIKHIQHKVHLWKNILAIIIIDIKFLFM